MDRPLLSVSESPLFTHFHSEGTFCIRLHTIHTHAGLSSKPTDVICTEICAFRSTRSLAGNVKLYANCWHTALAIWALRYVDLLLTKRRRGTTVLSQDARAHSSSRQGQTQRSVSRLLQKLWKPKQQKYGKYETKFVFSETKPTPHLIMEGDNQFSHIKCTATGETFVEFYLQKQDFWIIFASQWGIKTQIRLFSPRNSRNAEYLRQAAERIELKTREMPQHPPCSTRQDTSAGRQIYRHETSVLLSFPIECGVFKLLHITLN